MTNSSTQGISLPTSIGNAEKALSLCLCNKFKEAEDFLKPLDGACIYHLISSATISYLQAVLTYEREFIDAANLKVKEAANLCERYRKKHTWSETLHSLIGKPYFDDFSELELHAELCYAECLLESALLSFIQDENLVNFIKGGLKVRNAYNLYRNCLSAVEQQPKLLSQSTNKVDFDTGVYMGVGSFNVLLSLLPARILRLLEWVGFHGDRKKGMDWLHRGFELDGLRSPMCSITLLLYQIVIAPLLGLAETDIDYCTTVIDSHLKKYPESSIFLYFSGRLKQTQGLLDEALAEYEKSVSANIDWQQIHHICFWEMMWCYSFKGDWKRASEYAGKLARESKWSKSTYLYLEGSFLYMQYFELLRTCDPSKLEEIENLKEKFWKIYDEVPEHKQRIAGKSVPFEKFAISRVEKFKATGIMVLPGIELIQLWNGFTMFKHHKNTIEHFLQLSNTAYRDIESRTFSNPKNKHDYLMLCSFIKGICLRHLDQVQDAEKILQQVAESKPQQHSCKIDCYLPPFASCELALMYRSNGDNTKALERLQYTLKHYSKYGLESRLHFRIHSGIESLKELKSSGSDQPKKEVITKNDMNVQEGDCSRENHTPDDPLNIKSTSNDLTIQKEAVLESYDSPLDSSNSKNVIDEMTTNNIEKATDNKTIENGEVELLQQSLSSKDFENMSEASSTISPIHRSRVADLASDNPNKISKITYV